MGGHPFPGIPCTLCSKPVDLTVDLFADENGGAVHEQCYVKRIIKPRNQRAADKLLNMLSTQPPVTYCPYCKSLLVHIDTTFESQNGTTWTIPLPICQTCAGAVPSRTNS